MIWHEHFALQRPPFSKDVEDTDLLLTPHKKQAVDDLLDGIRDRVTGAIIVGDAGGGKSCVLRAVRWQLRDSNVRLTYCHNTTLGRRDFYRQICTALGLNPRATAAGVFDAVSTYVQELACEQLHPVFLIDEAHLLHQDVLDHLHILANYEWDSRPLLTFVFAGLPELWDRMLLRRNRALWSRIHTRLRLPDPEPADTVAYVDHRLRLAGAKAELFTTDAVSLLHEGSAGRLRDIDRIATAALKAAARSNYNRVDRALMVNIIASHQR